MAKLWSGRFKSDTDAFVDEMNASITFDKELFPYDILGSIAHVKMLARQGIITRDEADKIIEALYQIREELSSPDYHFPIEDEDIHMHIERKLIERLGDTGKKVHTARSRNDQVALDVRMYVKAEAVEVAALIVDLQEALVKKAREYKEIIIPGYTHLQRAQPVLFSHHLLAYYQMLVRDFERVVFTYREADHMPLGSAALAGTTLPIDREFVKNFLGFHFLAENSMDAVSDRDFILNFLFSAAVISMHLSRLAEELILWSTTEFNLVQIDERYTTGSSIMPQKRNPDLAELVRGKTGRIYGNLHALLVTLKGLPMTYNKDLQEDKEPLFDTVKHIKLSLLAMIKMISTLTVNRNSAEKLLKGGYLTATDLAEYLVIKGIPFREAHKITGKIVALAEEKGVELSELSIEDLKKFSSEIEDDIYQYLTPESAISRRKSAGGTAPDEVENAIERASREVEWRRKFTENLFQPW